jgi:tetratricopeptide (TPR) repeat protein
MPSTPSPTEPARRVASVCARLARVAGVLLGLAAHGLVTARALAQEPTPPPDTGAETIEAEAAQDYERARLLSREGLEAFQLKDFATAILKFEESHRLSKLPLLLYNLAQAHRLAGNCAEARRYYGEFLTTGPEGENRTRAEHQLEKLAACVSATRAETAPPSPLARAAEPLEAPDPAPPTRSRVFTVPSGSARALDGRREGSSRAVRAAVGFGSSALLLGTSAYFGWQAKRASDEVSSAYRDHAAWSSHLAATEESGERSERLAIATLVTGLVATGVSIWLVSFE